jgi:hypothetical protein
MTFDDLRAAHPDLVFNVYAMEPGGAVTLEIIAPGEPPYTFAAPTLAEAIAEAFPPAPEIDAFD